MTRKIKTLELQFVPDGDGNFFELIPAREKLAEDEKNSLMSACNTGLNSFFSVGKRGLKIFVTNQRPNDDEYYELVRDDYEWNLIYEEEESYWYSPPGHTPEIIKKKWVFEYDVDHLLDKIFGRGKKTVFVYATAR